MLEATQSKIEATADGIVKTDRLTIANVGKPHTGNLAIFQRLKPVQSAENLH
jgi:hypothetical protein